MFDPADDKMDVDAEEAKAADRERADKDEYKDVTNELKRSKRGKKPINEE